MSEKKISGNKTSKSEAKSKTKAAAARVREPVSTGESIDAGAPDFDSELNGSGVADPPDNMTGGAPPIPELPSVGDADIVDGGGPPRAPADPEFFFDEDVEAKGTVLAEDYEGGAAPDLDVDFALIPDAHGEEVQELAGFAEAAEIVDGGGAPALGLDDELAREDSDKVDTG